MSSSQGGESIGALRSQPSDLGGFNVMIHAKLMYPVLLKDRSQPILVTGDGLPAWNDVDRASFSFYRWIHDGLTFAEPSDGIKAAHREVDLLHACLPLSDGERRWMIDAYDANRDEGDRLDQAIVGSEATITTNGLRQVIKGQELVRRWAAWRREIDEFAGQGIIKETRQHLRRIRGLLDGSIPSTPAS
jgi:hypothetical protein